MQFIGHTGRFNGVPATNRKVCWTENNIYRINDGKIAETWTETSFHDLMAQITSKQAEGLGKKTVWTKTSSGDSIIRAAFDMLRYVRQRQGERITGEPC